MLFGLLFPGAGSIVSALFLGSIEGDLFHVAELLDRGLDSTRCLSLFHGSSGFGTSLFRVFVVSNNLESLLCDRDAATSKGSSAPSSMGEPDGRLRIGIMLDSPHPATSDVQAFQARERYFWGRRKKEWGWEA
jgi:hypothetical protein